METCDPNTENFEQSKKRLPVFDQDLNLPPNIVDLSETELFETRMAEETTPGMTMRKKKRAASKDVAKISYEDLAQYFGLPITEASRSLDVGVTVLKKKCRELGIPRWPHRKIKSLDSLIQNLQDEAERQMQENKAAVKAVEKRQKMLKTEKESIERTPFMEIQTETKKFRQDVFKRRHKARALNNDGPSTSST